MDTLTVIPTGEAAGIICLEHCSPIRIFGTETIRNSFGEKTLEQAVNARLCPGITNVALTPDAHVGYGAPIGCVMTSPSHIYPGPVGVDINCSMSLLQFELPEEALNGEKSIRRSIIQAIEKRVPTGVGKKRSPAVSKFPIELIKKSIVEGPTPEVCDAMDIPREWTLRCEESCRVGHDGTKDSLAARFDVLFRQFDEERVGADIIESKLRQLGSLGGGNHFAECEVVRLAEQEKRWEGDGTNLSVAQTFGLKDGNIAFLTHCGSRGFGNLLAQRQFALLKRKFQLWGIPFPGGDANLVYAPVGTQEADDYIDDMTLGANFATLNHLLINLQVLNAFREVFPGVQGKLVYYISHNIAKHEVIDGSLQWVHRKGATRAFPANHFALAETPFAKTGHPILLPGNPLQGSSVMVALEGAKDSFYSVNHGAGRAKGRRDAMRLLDQNEVDSEFDSADILTNCRQYPRDEAPAAYKDFNEVLRSVELAGLAREVARLKARFVIKDSSTPDD